MYNFRYHLITIVSIFAALALGLLLGVAITGSDLVKDASTNLAESLTKQFDELNAKNDELLENLEVQRVLASQILGDWQGERLKGRTIVVLTQTGDAGTALSDELGALIREGGGIPVSIYVNDTDGFGINDEKELAALKALLPEVEGETYDITLARALTTEWSTLAPANAEFTSAAFGARYPLTSALVTSGKLFINADYQPLSIALEEAEAAGISSIQSPASANEGFSTGDAEGNQDGSASASSALSAQRTALDIAQQLRVPYGANGVIDASFSSAGVGSQMRVDEVSLQIALAFDSLGASDSLPYFLPVNSATAGASAEGEKPETLNNYFALLVGEQTSSTQVVDTAQKNSLSCVIDPAEQLGHYSVIALFSGGEKGSYGLNLQAIQPLPLTPGDKIGNAAFVK